MEIWYTIVIGVLSLISGILSSKGSLYDRRRKFFKRLNGRGVIVVVIGMLVIILSYLQYRTNKRSEELQSNEISNERRVRDSIVALKIAEGIDSSRRKLYNDLSIALANQYFKLDTVKKEIVKLIDSSQTANSHKAERLPILIIPSNGIKFIEYLDSISLDVSLVSKASNSILDNIFIIIELLHTDGTIGKTSATKFTNGELNLPMDQPINNLFEFAVKKRVDIVNVLIFGSYKSQMTGKSIRIKDAYRYRVSKNNTELILGEEKDLLYHKYNQN